MKWLSTCRYECVLFFDSFGRSPYDRDFPKYFRDFANSFKAVSYVKERVQHDFSVACGYFCVHMIYVLSFDLKVDSFIRNYDLTNLQENDDTVLKIVKSII